ncbi:methyltransferase [Legionella nautarum]|uniref:Methyltransferase n=1 Tax=Legionella nautarum TaxID=45070 RepID=A0A0W0WKB8_9GAMM|nr:tetratricopeptide repeat protein [Legionella nautarum]KTD32765.1 methyltransferase [Legionella nautarum]
MPIKKKKADAEKWYKSGLIHFNEGRFEKAILDFNKAIDLNCTNAEYFFCRGNAYRKLGNFLAARRNYKKATSIDPNHFPSYTNWALSYTRAYEGLNVNSPVHDHFKMADKCYKKAIEIKPSFVVPYYNLGNIYYRNGGDLNAAKAYFDQAIQYDPNHASAYNNRGNAYLALGEKDLALADYNKAVEIDPFCIAAYINRSKINLEKGNYKLALQDMPFITDEDLLRTIAERAKEQDNLPDIEALIKNARKLNFLITKYKLQLNEAEALLAMQESTRTWLLQGWLQLVTAHDIDNNRVDVNNRTNLPAELWEFISMFMVGLDRKGTYKVQDVLKQQLKDGFTERPYNNASFFKTTPQTREQIDAAESRYQRRNWF